MGNGDGPILGGPDEHILDDPRDLVALAPTDDDRLSGFLKDKFGWCCRVSISSLLYQEKLGNQPTQCLLLKDIVSWDPSQHRSIASTASR